MATTLHDLIGPLDVDTFVREHVLGGKHHLSRVPDEVLAEFGEIPEFQSVERLLATSVQVVLFGANGFLAPCPAETALGFLDEGYVLYITRVHTAVPAARDLLDGICAALGIHPRYVRLEAFVGKAGARSSMHYDHDLNFQILMRGTKRWRIQANANIDNPLESHHILTAPKDELYAHTLPLPREFSDPVSLVMEPGSCLFFPAGCWHEVQSVGPTFAVNVVIDPPRMHEIVAKALENVLAANSRYRGFALGMLGDGSPASLQAHATEEFERVREACLQALETLGPEDASVALEEGRYRWSAEHAERRLETAEDDAVRVSSSTGLHFELDHRFRPLLERLVRVQGSFDLPQLCASAPQVQAEEMLAVVLDLVGRGFLERDTT